MNLSKRLLSNSRGISPGLGTLDNRKHWVGALVGAGALLGSALLNKSSVDKNNATQKQLVEEQKEYNTPANQVNRLRDAGLNPYMMLGSVNSGNQENVASTQPTDYSSLGQAGVQLGSAVEQMLVNRAQIQNINADTRLKQIQGETQRDLVNAQIAEMQGSANLSNANAGYVGSQHRFFNDSYADRLLKEKYGWKTLSQQIAESQANQDLANARADRENYENLLRKTFGYRMSAAELKQAMAAYDFAQSNVAVNRAQIGLLGAQTGTEKQRKGFISNEKRVSFWNGRKLFWEAGSARKDYDFYDADKYIGYFGKIVSGGSEVSKKKFGRK